MRIPDQKMTMELPTLLIDARGSKVLTAPRGLEQLGYLAVEGELEYALTLDSGNDPTHLTVSARILRASYSPPADCSRRVLEIVTRVNANLAERILGDEKSDGYAKLL